LFFNFGLSGAVAAFFLPFAMTLASLQ